MAVTGAVVRFILEGFSTIRAMELTTILNHCYAHRGFVYEHARFHPDRKSIEVAVRPRKGSKGGLTPKIETIAIGTLCRERDCEWQKSERQAGTPRHFGRWRWNG